jgi:hypothetical protein
MHVETSECGNKAYLEGVDVAQASSPKAGIASSVRERWP